MTHHQHQSVLAQLRALVPRRVLNYQEAKRVVELQAHRLRELRGITEPELLEEAISSLPRLWIKRTTTLLPPEVSGISHWHDGRWVIALNALEPDTRQRFSLAHELWHIINHTTKQWLHPDSPQASGYARGERLADYFAACLLMPKRHVRALVAQGFNPHQLASAFDVSHRAMTIRLAALGMAGARSSRSPVVPGRHAGKPAYYRHNVCPQGAGV